MQTTTGTPAAELEARRGGLLDELRTRGLTGCVLFDADYVRWLGGFRHSDTVLVTPDGIELLTDHPRDLESLTIAA